ncbi:hypothetical protein [Quisquiliibacterium transsilvanicum]|uniref:Uncharacterized protein n=1 Tax=Quisquiliibacterium transsilvanicum TaxID=1549638 RepID=A0A7W8HG83_9BURK|nr:hypothetical protein [Quisquiliibacterium transsilvanicum]MBB5271368.1 hypothetical protein [Quisquiliibacterium transsilvanicum]
MKLYEVSVEFTMVVQAGDEEDAWDVARENVRDAVGDADPHLHVVRRVTGAAQLRDGWDGMCIPYGGDGNTRIKDILGEATE